MAEATRQGIAENPPGLRSPFVEVFRSRYAAGSPNRSWLRAWDSGTAGYVTWGPYANPIEHLAPGASETVPNFSGVLSGVHVIVRKP